MIPSVQERAVERLDMALHLLFVATDCESDPRRRQRQMDSILLVQQAIDSLAEPPAKPAPATKPIEDFVPKPSVTSEAVEASMPKGVWLTSEQVAEMVDWSKYDPSSCGKKSDIVHRLNHLARKGLVERHPPIEEGRRSHRTSWRLV